MERKNFPSGSKWEAVVGYSRAVRIGNIIEIAGTTASDGNNIVGKGSMYEQTKFILQKIEQTLKQAGASMNNVTRTRMFVTDISKWEEAARAHLEFFKNIKPVTTMVEVPKLIHPDLLIEIEVTAIF
jgi:enamine deaminase RidA (YjgF/YER057c/UK114 family)